MKQTKKGLIFTKIKPKILKKRKEFDIAFNCSGSVGDGELYALDLAPIENWIDAKVVVASDFIVYTCDYTSEKYDNDKTVCGYHPTVLEVFKAIFYEITFCGTPSNTHMQMKDLKKRIDDCKSGKAKTHPVIFK